MAIQVTSMKISAPYIKARKAFSAWLSRDLTMPDFPLSDFGRIQQELKMGDVILVEGSSRISSVIRMLTHSPWTHSAIYIGRLHDIENDRLRYLVKQHYHRGAEKDQLVIESLMGHGTIVSSLEKYRHYHLRLCRPKGISHADAQKVIAFCIKALGSPYHIRRIADLARFLLPWSIMPRRWISTLFSDKPDSRGEVCSSLIAKAFMSVKFPILPKILLDKKTGKVAMMHGNYRLFTPSDFDYSPYFEIIKYPMFNVVDEVNYRKLPWTDVGE